MNKSCLNCTITFSGKHSTQKYCSRNCYLKTKREKTLSIESREKLRNKRFGKNNPNWKDDKVSYGALHDWVKWHLIKPQTCRDCNQVKPLDLANISQEYKRDLTDWEWLCRSCHMKKDGRLDRLIAHGRREKTILNCQTCNIEFIVRPSGTNRKYCSKKCYGISIIGTPGRNLKLHI